MPFLPYVYFYFIFYIFLTIFPSIFQTPFLAFSRDIRIYSLDLFCGIIFINHKFWGHRFELTWIIGAKPVPSRALNRLIYLLTTFSPLFICVDFFPHLNCFFLPAFHSSQDQELGISWTLLPSATSVVRIFFLILSFVCAFTHPSIHPFYLNNYFYASRGLVRLTGYVTVCRARVLPPWLLPHALQHWAVPWVARWAGGQVGRCPSHKHRHSGLTSRSLSPYS